MLDVIMLRVSNKPSMLNVVMMNLIVLSVFVLNVVILSVIMLNVVAPSKTPLSM
jgi:hypothetical protein